MGSLKNKNLRVGWQFNPGEGDGLISNSEKKLRRGGGGGVG